MTRLRAQLKQGITGQGWTTAAVAIALAVGVYVTSLGYDALNHGPNVVFLRTPLDEAVPLVKPFVVPYVSLNPVTYLSLIAFLLFRIRIYQSAALSMIGAFLVSYLFFHFMQSYVARPQVTGDDLFSRMIRSVYAGDNPYNDFPSLHVSVSTVLAIHWWRVGRVPGWIAAVWAVVVVASTQFVHQHYLVDVAGGLAVAFGVTYVVGVGLARLALSRAPGQSGHER